MVDVWTNEDLIDCMKKVMKDLPEERPEYIFINSGVARFMEILELARFDRTKNQKRAIKMRNRLLKGFTGL